MPTTLNQYTLGRTLGSGVSCKVKLAKDNSNTRYAVKIIHSNEQFQELIDSECEALTNLQHPNIVRLIEVGRGTQRNTRKGEKDVNFIVLELVGGGELWLRCCLLNLKLQPCTACDGVRPNVEADFFHILAHGLENL